ncbi:MAG TPA: hypothetical protein VMS96_14080 [Terriglobales bacterium]|nr:hypothetical protein [Terriglobales bacterium]
MCRPPPKRDRGPLFIIPILYVIVRGLLPVTRRAGDAEPDPQQAD